jgi:post-segregation antitoxin (ccd killing protein)
VTAEELERQRRIAEAQGSPLDEVKERVAREVQRRLSWELEERERRRRMSEDLMMDLRAEFSSALSRLAASRLEDLERERRISENEGADPKYHSDAREDVQAEFMNAVENKSAEPTGFAEGSVQQISDANDLQLVWLLAEAERARKILEDVSSKYQEAINDEIHRICYSHFDEVDNRRRMRGEKTPVRSSAEKQAVLDELKKTVPISDPQTEIPTSLEKQAVLDELKSTIPLANSQTAVPIWIEREAVLNELKRTVPISNPQTEIPSSSEKSAVLDELKKTVPISNPQTEIASSAEKSAVLDELKRTVPLQPSNPQTDVQAELHQIVGDTHRLVVRGLEEKEKQRRINLDIAALVRDTIASEMNRQQSARLEEIERERRLREDEPRSLDVLAAQQSVLRELHEMVSVAKANTPQTKRLKAEDLHKHTVQNEKELTDFLQMNLDALHMKEQ